MRQSDRNTISAITLFDQSLDQYESAMDAITINPNLFSGPAQYLQMALNRLVTSSTPDGIQMLRSLAKRMVSGKSCYTERAILLIASQSVNIVFKDEVMAVMYALLNVTRGIDAATNQAWLNRVNGSTAIKIVFDEYKTSDLKILAATPSEAIAEATLPSQSVYSSNESVVLPLNNAIQEVFLTGSIEQSLSLTKDPNWKKDIPVQIYTSSIIVSSLTKSFRIPKTVRTTPLCDALLVELGCVDAASSFMNYRVVKLPGQFFTCQLDVISQDSGQTWILTNIQIRPPRASV